MNVFTAALIVSACALSGAVVHSEHAGQDEKLESLVIIDGKQYFFSGYELDAIMGNASIAARHCNSIGMNLVSFETREEYLQVQNYIDLTGTFQTYWTSGHTFNEEWIWTGSGKMFADDVMWYPGQPNEADQCTACAFVWPNYMGLMDDACYSYKAFICE